MTSEQRKEGQGMSAWRKMSGFPHSSHKMIVADDGSWVFDLYFFGDDCYSDSVTQIHVDCETTVRAREDMELWARRSLVGDEALAEAIDSRFGSVPGVRTWLDALRLPYTEIRDPFATDDPAWQTVTLMNAPDQATP
jgi:hypothetical protein